MDRTQRPMGQESCSPTSASTIDFQIDPKSQVGARFISTATGIMDRRLGTYDLPMGAPGRNPASPVSMAEDKGVVGIGQGYADGGILDGQV